MATQEELAKAWAKGQPGFGLYLGCRAVRRAAGNKGAVREQTGRFDAGKGELLTVVTVENVVDGMARVCEEGSGKSVGAPIDTLVLFKLAKDVGKLQGQGNAAKGKVGGGRVDGEEVKPDCAQPGNWSDLFSTRSKQNLIIPTSSSSDIQDDAEEEEGESKYGVDWKPGVGTSSGNNWYDCMKFVAPISPAAEAVTLRSNQFKPSLGTNSEASDCLDLGKPSHAAESSQGHLFPPGRTSNHIRRAGGRSRRTRREEAQEPRRRMDSPIMEEMEKEKGAEERSLDVRHLLEQLKVAREAEGGKHEVGGAIIGLEGDAVALEGVHQVKVEEIVNIKQTKLNALEASPIVTNINSDVGVFNIENAKPRKAIDDASGAIVEGEEEFEGQVSDNELDGDIEAPEASRVEGANKEARLLGSSASLVTDDQSAFLPTSLPTAASVSRWVEGDQLHKVSGGWEVILVVGAFWLEELVARGQQ